MAYPSNPDDRPDPMDNAPPMRARVPEHVASGQISTGVIVVTGATEYILDFVRNLPRPNMIVARVVLPHQVMPQFIEALNTNIGLYRQRFTDLNLPQSGIGPIQSYLDPNHVSFPPGSPPASPSSGPQGKLKPDDTSTESLFGRPIDIHSGTSVPSSGQNPLPDSSPDLADQSHPKSDQLSAGGSGEDLIKGNFPQHTSPSFQSPLPPPQIPSSVTRHPSPQEVYDELKLRDELLSGSYANAVMIGHGPHEFSFDFITNFYPQSAVSCRVFMAAGHVARLLDSLRASWDQLRPRLG